MTLFGIIFAIIIFSVVIALHELGHFVAAKLSNVQVNEFALFMGPAIFKKQKAETLYSIRCIPIGGYCAMEGEDEDTENPRSFQKAVWWKRLIILVSGSAMNLLTGFLLLALFFAFNETYSTPVIARNEELCTIVYEEGLHVGDRLVEIDGYNVYTANDAKMLLSFADETADIVVERDGIEIEFKNYRLDNIYLTKCKCGRNIYFNNEMKTESVICPKCQTKIELSKAQAEEKYGIDFGY